MASTRERLVFDTLDLNDNVTYSIEGVDAPPPAKRREWVQAADGDGGFLARDPLFENRELKLRIRVRTQTTMDLALEKIGAIVDKIEEAERTAGGLGLVWTPATATNSFTLYVLTGEISELPLAMSGADTGWFQRAPVITVKLTCRPFGYGAEVVGSGSSSTLPLMTIELTNVDGDVPAEGRLIITDAATQNRRHVEWGLESLFYPTSSPPALLIDSASLAVTGFSGSTTTRTGAYSGSGVVRATLPTDPTAVCGTGNLGHVGTFRVKARVWASSADVRLRLSWRDGNGPYRANEWATPPVASAFAEVDLGTVTVTAKTLGTQRWVGKIEAYGSSTPDTLDVDFLALLPAAEGYGVARGPVSTQPPTVVAFDYAAGSIATTLNSRTALLGGTWATSGVATDFAIASGYLDLWSRSTISEASPRFAVLGSTSFTDTDVELWVRFSDLGFYVAGCIARWTSSSAYLRAYLDGSGNFVLGKVVGGVPTTLDTTLCSISADTFYRIRIICNSSGTCNALLMTASENVLGSLQATDSVLATAGTLATGKPGFFDWNAGGTATVRQFYNFTAATPAEENIALYSGQSLEVRSDDTIREDSSGTYWGPAPSYRGARFFVPVAGPLSRKTRIAVKARRHDILVGADDQIADNLTVQANYTPRWVAIPR